MRNILREPLFHFLLIGAAFFLLFNRFGASESREDTIVIDDSDIDRMIDTWQMQWQRPPTQSELNNLLSEHLRQEVFYREALKMQLDHNDEIVKRRLYQKMEFLMDDIAEMAQPTEEELRAYHDAHIEKYAIAPVLSFTAIYFNPDQRPDPEAEASALKKLLPRKIGRDFDTREYGDATMIQPQYWNISESALARNMGTAFAASVFQLDTAVWQGPLPSGYGWHLVYIHDKTGEEIAEWEDVRSSVLIDLQYDWQREYSESVYEELQKNYTVVFEFRDENRDSLQNMITD
jgi:hypothetical protein